MACKLKGAENYHIWKFAITNYLKFRGLSKAIKNETAETDATKKIQAKSLLVLSVEPTIYAHIDTIHSANSALKI